MFYALFVTDESSSSVLQKHVVVFFLSFLLLGYGHDKPVSYQDLRSSVTSVGFPYIIFLFCET